MKLFVGEVMASEPLGGHVTRPRIDANILKQNLHGCFDIVICVISCSQTRVRKQEVARHPRGRSTFNGKPLNLTQGSTQTGNRLRFRGTCRFIQYHHGIMHTALSN